MPTSIDIVVPDLGDFSDVEVIEVLVAPGDRVERENGLVTLETDKAAMDVPAPEQGVIEKITVGVGDTVSSGSIIGRMSIEAADTVVEMPALATESADAGAEGDAESADAGAEADAESSSAPEAAQESDAGRGDKTGNKQTLVVPDIGDFEGVEIIEVHVSAGDEVAVEDPLVTLETDKAAMDVPAVLAGRIDEVLVKAGDKVSEGTGLAIVETGPPESASGEEAPARAQPAAGGKTGGERTAAPAERSPAPKSTPEKAPAARSGRPAINEAGFAKAHASPSVRKLARELGVDLARVEGSGPKSRVLHDDVKAFVKDALSGKPAAGTALPQTPSVDFSKFGEIETQPLTRIQKISGPRLQASWINLPHVTQHDEADITALEERRQALKGPAKERGIPLTPLAFVIKACVSALREFPTVNASLSDDGASLVIKHYCHIGFAADTEQGLMVPVIRDADTKDIYELATDLRDLSAAARDGKLKANDLQGATFTVSSLGGIGGTAFTPIVNAPEVAILGVSRSAMQPVWDGEQFQPRLMLPLSLSYDHRVIDGAMAVRFTTFLGKALADVDTLLQAIP